MKIGLLLIATGKYDVFLEPLFNSVKKFFFIEDDVHFFIFTDSKKWLETKIENVCPFYIEHKPFPAPTLFRYETFLLNEIELSRMDYLYYCDVDMLFVDFVGREILGDRVATLHPGFVGGVGTPERRIESLAYIPYEIKNSYFAGGFNGGSSSEFLKMSKKISENIKKDLEKNIIAIWHDESHMNRYFCENNPTLILSPSYCYPESWNIPYKKKLLALDKNHEEMRR